MLHRYKIADVVFDAFINYRYSATLCKNYEYVGEEKPEFIIKITQDDIEYEKKLSFPEVFPDSYLESLSLFRKLCNHIIDNKQAIVFHGSCVSVDDKAYIFTAVSGTGKSTHVNYWKEYLKDRAVIVNDDKPIVRIVDGEVYAYGTPWMGKHSRGNNMRVKVKAICKLERGEVNSIEKITAKDMILTFLNQTLRFSEEDKTDRLFEVMNKVLTSVDLYRLKCNMSVDSAKLSYGVMSKDEN